MSVFKRRRFPAEIILLCVRWYCRYGISYRDLEEMMAERGVAVDHVTLCRWVQRHAPELEKRVRWYQATDHRPGAWTKPTSGWVASGNTCSVPSTRLSGIPCGGRCHHAKVKRSSNRMASWALAIT